MELLQREMGELDAIDRPGSDVEQYVAFLEANLRTKAEMVEKLRTRLAGFKQLLREDARISGGAPAPASSGAAAAQLPSIGYNANGRARL